MVQLFDAGRWVIACLVVVVLPEILLHFQLKADIICHLYQDRENDEEFINQTLLRLVTLTNRLAQVEVILQAEDLIFREGVLRQDHLQEVILNRVVISA